MKAQKSCNFVTLNQIDIEDVSDTTISGYFRINDYLLTSDGSVKFDIKAQFNPNSDFKYVKLYSDSLCNNYLMSLFNVCDTIIRVFLKFRMFDFTEFIYGLDVELRSFVGINTNEKNLKLKLFPNPVTNNLYIDSKKNDTKQLFNSIGELILETQSNTINLKELTVGLYFLRINGNMYKIIKSK